MRSALDDVLWPAERAGEALAALSRASGLSPDGTEAPNPRASIVGDPCAFAEWLESASARLGVEAEPVEVAYPEVSAALLAAGPGIVRVSGVGGTRLVALAGARRRRLYAIGPDLRARRVPAGALAAALCRTHVAPLESDVDGLLEAAGVSPRRRSRARDSVLAGRLAQTRVEGVWLLRLPPSAGVWRQLRRARLLGPLVATPLLYALHYAFVLLSWWVLGAGALGGRLDRGWLVAWALLLLTAAPLRVLGARLQGRFAVGAGALLKARLLAGALRLAPEEVRTEGAGRMLGRVIESEALEALAMSGGFMAVLAGVEVVAAGVVLSLGAGGWLLMGLFAAWTAVMVGASRVVYGRRAQWTEARLEMTGDLVERMVGHRTRLAQEDRDDWHQDEDRALGTYVERSLAMDRAAVLQALVPRAWVVVGLLGLTPSFLAAESPASLAVAVGGVLLGHRALARLAASAASLLGVAIAWDRVAPLFHAAARPEPVGMAEVAISRAPRAEGESLLEARSLSFRYASGARPVLAHCDLSIGHGDRLLVEGPSGGGKSTLAALLAGTREPDSGLLLLGGLDFRTLGPSGWRRRVVAAPQFHENYVFSATFAFNVLLGRKWPPTQRDLDEAESLCRELDLGDLLDRMPAGLMQMVGETGWQLSHGERSRLFMARALLQGSDLVILDESFGALDPATLRRCMDVALSRAETLLVIAHP
jgi:ATP-binding cassette, subfamily B, bacterial